ncbi:MAG: hypothetical protein ACRCUE_15130 [Bosea sp. (in: a-proteobacteria)]
MTVEELRDLKKKVDEMAASANASVNISSDGVWALVVGIGSIMAVLLSASLSFVSWQQSVILSARVDDLRSRVSMQEARIVNMESRLRRIEEPDNER